MEKEKDSVSIAPNDLVIVTKMNHITEVQHMEKMNTQASIKKLDKHRYIDLQTGEIREFELSENRADNFNSLRQTFKKLRYLINSNFEGKSNELHVTLTYEENMTDTKRLYTDFDKFMKRLRYRYKNESSIDYLSVVEPQERGAWHCHVLMKFNDLEKIYIPNKFDKNNNPIDAPMFELWDRNGWVTIRSLKDIDNIGAYLSGYLTDIELSDSNIDYAATNKMEIKTVDVEGVSKKFIKGGRLPLYPSGMNLYRSSRGIKMPEREKMLYKNVKKIVGSAKPHYQKSYEIENDDFQNVISFQQYNTKRG